VTVNQELLETARDKLYTGVLSDILDGQGFRHQVVPPHIRPLDEGLVLVGRARTGLYRDAATALIWSVSPPWGGRAMLSTSPRAHASVAATPSASIIEPTSDWL
jgi:hypothetical protein